jgi:hypothetical protein
VTDRVTQEYVQRCLTDGGRLRTAVRQARPPRRYLECFGERMMPRPFFLPESEFRRAGDDLISIFELLVSLPGRLFDGDVARYCAALGYSPRQSALMRRLGGGRPALFGRSDLYHDGTSLKLLEFNVGSQLGGIDQSQIPPALLGVDVFAEFAREHRLDYLSTGEKIARSLYAAAEPVTGGAPPVVALLEADGAMAPLMKLLLSFQELLGGFGLDVRLAEVSQVRNQGGKLYLDNTPIDIVLRYFSVNQICRDPDGEAAVEPIFQAHEAGGTVLMTTLESFLFANKGCLALLSDPQWRDAYTPAERALIDRVVPWTRGLTAGPTDVDGRGVDLIEYCRDQRDRLILKPRNDFGGNGIVVGWERTDAEWKEALTTCATGDYIVQERVVQRREPVVDPDSGELQDWVCAWSTFVTPEGFSGSHIRALPADQTGIIGRGANAATRVTGVFCYPDEG